MSDALSNKSGWFDKEKAKAWSPKYRALNETLYCTRKGNFIVRRISGYERVSHEFAVCWLLDNEYNLPADLKEYKNDLEV